MTRPSSTRSALVVVCACVVSSACATTFRCGRHAQCQVATEYCQTTTPGAVDPEGAPSPVSHCQRFDEGQAHACPDFTPASACGCHKDWWTGAVHIGCNAP